MARLTLSHVCARVCARTVGNRPRCTCAGSNEVSIDDADRFSQVVTEPHLPCCCSLCCAALFVCGVAGDDGRSASGLTFYVIEWCRTEPLDVFSVIMASEAQLFDCVWAGCRVA